MTRTRGALDLTVDQNGHPHFAVVSKVGPAAQNHGNMAQKVYVGMYLCAVGDFDCDDKDNEEINTALETEKRPMTLTFALPDLSAAGAKSGDDDILQIQVRATTRRRDL